MCHSRGALAQPAVCLPPCVPHLLFGDLTLAGATIPNLDALDAMVPVCDEIWDLGFPVQVRRWKTMSSQHFRSSRPDQWTLPRPYQDASLRYIKHGPIQPMDQPGFLARLFGR